MNASDINFALKGRLGEYVNFIGTFPREYIERLEIPNIRKRHIAVIYNTLHSKSTKRMGHWVSLIITRSPCKQIIWFDSAGFKPEHYSEEFSNFFKRHSDFSHYNFSFRLQPLFSRMCGLYNIYWIREISLYDLSRGLSRIRAFFAGNTMKQNDKRVLHYYLKRLNARSCLYLLKIFKSPFVGKHCII